MIEKESIYHHSFINLSTSFEPVYPRFTLNEKKNQIFMPKVLCEQDVISEQGGAKISFST